MFGRCWKKQNLSTSTNQLSILQGESYMAIYIYILYIYVITKAITGLCKETASCWHSFRLCNGTWTWSCSHPVCRFKKRNVRNVAPLFNALNPIPLLLTGGPLRNWICWDFHISQVHQPEPSPGVTLLVFLGWRLASHCTWESLHHDIMLFRMGKETVICDRLVLEATFGMTIFC